MNITHDRIVALFAELNTLLDGLPDVDKRKIAIAKTDAEKLSVWIEYAIKTAVVVPVDTHIRFVVTANDVIHCFTIPSLGIKIDATPGRLNQVSALIQRTGVYYGQCSELCGVNHALMPIKLECVSISDFIE